MTLKFDSSKIIDFEVIAGSSKARQEAQNIIGDIQMAQRGETRAVNSNDKNIRDLTASLEHMFAVGQPLEITVTPKTGRQAELLNATLQGGIAFVPAQEQGFANRILSERAANNIVPTNGALSTQAPSGYSR